MPESRQLPHNLESEEGVNGSLLLNGKVISRISNILRPEDFLSERNRFIYQACVNIDNRGESIDITTVSAELDRQGNLEKAGGYAYLNNLIASTPTYQNVEDYARDVYRNSIARQIITAANDIQNVGYAANPDTSAAISEAEDILYKVRQERGSQDFVELRKILTELAEEEAHKKDSDNQELTRIKTGLDGLDNYIGGFQRTDLIILAGRTSMGKTSLALNIAQNAALNYGATVAIFSLEMSRGQLANRLIAGEAEINSRKFIDYNFTDEEEIRRMDAIGKLGDAKIFIDDTSMLRISEMRSKARRLHADHPVDLIILDYLQLLQGEGKTENRVLEIGNFTRALKSIARELNVPVIALSQLSRAVDRRGDQSNKTRIPQLSDLRESGSIEQDADLVLFVHREAMYYRTEEEWARQHPGEEYPRELADIIIAKNRNGATGSVRVHFKPEYTKFGNLATENLGTP